MEDLTQYREKDLPGATHTDDDPLHIFEPTIQMIDEYRCNQDYCNKTIRDLGVSAKEGGNVTD
jgi:hypothetical protein